MSHTSRLELFGLLGVAALACGLGTGTVPGVQDLASTAEAVASSIPSAMPNIPDVTGYLNPTGAPAKDWNGIPVMKEATAGQEFDKNTYSFKAGTVAAADAQSFYNTQLKGLGWSSSFSGTVGSEAVMVFTKGSSVLTIVVTKSDKDTVVLLFKQ